MTNIMIDQDQISFQVTDIMKEVMSHIPSDMSSAYFEAYCSSLLNMAFLMVKLGDIEVITENKNTLHVVADTALGTRKITVNVEFE